MVKYHIKDNGEPGICKASPGKCPLGADNPHFETKQEARKEAERILEEKHGLTTSVSKNFEGINFSKLNGYEIVDIRSRIESDELDEDTAKHIVESTDSFNTLQISVLISEGDVSLNTRVKAYQKYDNLLTERVYKSKGFNDNLEGLTPHLSEDDYMQAVRYANNEQFLEDAIDDYRDLVKNNYAGREKETRVLGQMLYMNENVSDEQKRFVGQHNHQVSLLLKLDEVKDEGVDLDTIITQRRDLSTSSIEEVYAIDVEKVKYYGLTEEHIKEYISTVKGNQLWAPTYDEETRRYKGLRM